MRICKSIKSLCIFYHTYVRPIVSVNHNLVAIVIIVAVFPLRYVLLQTKQLSMEYVCYGYWVFLCGMHRGNRNS